MQIRRKTGFTVVELLVVIVVLGILASIGVVGYGAWKTRTAQNVIKSDLINVVAAMESARNFGTRGYPATVPATVSASKDVTFFGGGFNNRQAFCVQATSTQSAGVIMHVTNTNKTPQTGSCSTSSGVMAVWPMNGTSDASGNSPNLVGYNVTPATGQNGLANNAYGFNGTNAYMDGGTSTNFTFTNNFTLSAWIYPTGYHTVGTYGLMNGIIARGPATTYNYALELKDSTTISFIKRTGAEGLQFNNFTGVPTLTNKWTLVTAVVAGGNVTLYINGQVFGSSPIVGSIAGAANDRLFIGTTGGNSNPETLFIGSIDDVRIINRALHAADVIDLYADGAL